MRFHRGTYSYGGPEQASIGVLGQEASFTDSMERSSLSPKADVRFLGGDSTERTTDTGLISKEVLERAALSRQLQNIYEQMESLKHAGGHSVETSEENGNEGCFEEGAQQPVGAESQGRPYEMRSIPELRLKAINEGQDEYEMRQRNSLEMAHL